MSRMEYSVLKENTKESVDSLRYEILEQRPV
jgi:hypothetical protein